MTRGRREGFAGGRRAGLKTGRSEGFDRGADSAFRAFPDWRPGAWYVVRIADGQGRSRFTFPGAWWSTRAAHIACAARRSASRPRGPNGWPWKPAEATRTARSTPPQVLCRVSLVRPTRWCPA